MQDALGAFLCGKWNYSHQEILPRSASKGLLVVFVLTAPLKAFSITNVQLSSSSIQNWWEGAQGKCGFASLGHWVGSAVGILFSGCVSASLLCSLQAGRDYSPPCSGDLRVRGLWDRLECSLINNCCKWHCLPWNTESCEPVVVHSFLGRGRIPSEMAENSEGWQVTLYPHPAPCGICCFLP